MKTTPSFFTVLGLIILGLTIPGRAEPSIGEVLARLKKAEEEIARLKNSMNASDASAAQKGSGKAKAAATSKPEPVIPVTGQKGGKADAALKSVELKETDGDVTLKQLTDAFDVPESPAAAAAGVPQQKTRHLQTPKQLIPAVISGMDEHGKFKSGLSVDWAPMQYFWGRRKVGDFRYDDNAGLPEDLATWGRRILVRTQLSLAVTRGTTDTDKSSKIALGVHSVIANSDDALSGAQPKRVDRGGDEGLVYEANDGGRLGGNGKFLNHWVLGGREFEPPRNGRLFSDDFSSDKWWKTPARYIYSHVSWSVGGAPLWFAPDDKTDYDYAGATFWSSFSYSPSRERPYKFVADVIYKNGEILPAEDAIGGTAALPVGANGMAPKTIKQDSLFITGGIDLGNRDFHVTFTASYLELDQHALGKDSAFQYAATVEKRIGGSNSWMTLSVSKDDGHDDGRNPTIVLGGVKVGLGGEDFGGVSQKLRDLAR